MMIHDDPRFALWFTFRLFIHELALHPDKFVPALIVLSMLAYVGFERIRAFRRQRRRLAEVDQQEPPNCSPDFSFWPISEVARLRREVRVMSRSGISSR